MNQTIVMGIVRHALTFIGGILIAKGVFTESAVADLTGLIMTTMGTIWSIVEKVKVSKGK